MNCHLKWLFTEYNKAQLSHFSLVLPGLELILLVCAKYAAGIR